MNTHVLPIIGYHNSPLSQKFGVPRQPNLVAVKSHIRFVVPYDTPDAFVGIERYSHLWILWQFHHNKEQANFRPQVRPPRLGGNDKIGVFATRSMYRPAGVGLSVVGLDRVEVVDNQVILHITGTDMVDGTPILDIKPYLPYVDGVNGATGFDKPTGRNVVFNDKTHDEFDVLIKSGLLTTDDKALIGELIAQDPRPAYRQSEIGVVCAMRYGAVDVDFVMNEWSVMVVSGVRVI
mgnify:CR=1 FL=1